ncbi:[NiFe]-hydrogenase assembly chaperone HybE [Thiolapillus sp.]|uniref:[NiFe]-hydrogenase assembly chaperone HybE n=2 Tax=Thiolapillus sp. TaxID=2017437 RepID=UPI0025F816D0|nr:[NiFe]-hydrogenase assembly chaperone HybE [Thiolapillus sp.]
MTHATPPLEDNTGMTVTTELDEAERKQLCAHLERVYTDIYEQRMRDIPITNDNIGIRAVGLRRWQNTLLCIMVTPWFMNIMLLPDEHDDWDELRETSSVYHQFPSGRYEFLVGYEPELGKYQMCSLFSPMFEFSDHQAAIETAEAAVAELMNEDNFEQVDIDSKQIARIWSGEEPHPELPADSPTNTDNIVNSGATNRTTDRPRQSLQKKMQRPISRRQLLRGAAMLDEDNKA